MADWKDRLIAVTWRCLIQWVQLIQRSQPNHLQWKPIHEWDRQAKDYRCRPKESSLSGAVNSLKQEWTRQQTRAWGARVNRAVWGSVRGNEIFSRGTGGKEKFGEVQNIQHSGEPSGTNHNDWAILKGSKQRPAAIHRSNTAWKMAASSETARDETNRLANVCLKFQNRLSRLQPPSLLTVKQTKYFQPIPSDVRSGLPADARQSKLPVILATKKFRPVIPQKQLQRKLLRQLVPRPACLVATVCTTKQYGLPAAKQSVQTVVQQL